MFLEHVEQVRTPQTEAEQLSNMAAQYLSAVPVVGASLSSAISKVERYVAEHPESASDVANSEGFGAMLNARALIIKLAAINTLTLVQFRHLERETDTLSLFSQAFREDLERARETIANAEAEVARKEGVIQRLLSANVQKVQERKEILLGLATWLLEGVERTHAELDDTEALLRKLDTNKPKV
jgi:type IV secretory pathway VirB4 component